MNTAPVHPTQPQEDKEHHALDISDVEDPAAPRGQGQDSVTRERRFVTGKFYRNRMSLLGIIMILSLFSSWLAIEASFKRFEAPIGPSEETANAAWERAFSEPNRTAEQWEQCIYREYERCYNETAFAHHSKAEQMETIAAANKDKIDQLSKLETHCALSLSNAKMALQEEVFGSGMLPWKDTCSPQNQAAILDAAGDNVRKGENAIIALTAQTTQEDRHQLSIIEEWFEEYYLYNKEYFFGAFEQLKIDLFPQLKTLPDVIDITFPGFDALISCLSTVTNDEVPCPITPIPVSLHGITYISEGIIAVAKEQLELAEATIATLVARYDEKVDDILNIIRIIQSIRNVLGRPFDLALNRLGGIDFGKFDNLPPGYLFVPGELDFPAFPDRPPIQPILDAFSDEILRAKAASIEIVKHVKDEVKDAVDSFVTNLELGIDKILDDYHPPLFPGFRNASDFGAALREFDERHKKRRAQLENALNDYRDAHTTTFANVSELEDRVYDEVDLDVPENYKDPETLFVGFRFPEIPEVVKTIFRFISDNWSWFDCIFRFYIIYCRYRKMLEPSSVPVPVIVVGTPGADRFEEAEQERKENMNMSTKIFNLIFNENAMWYVGIGCFIILALAVGGYGSNKLIKHHQHNCVDNKTGSLFSRHFAVPAIHDISTFQGNTAMIAKEGQLYRQRVYGGTTLKASSELLHRQLQDSLFDIEYDYNKTMAESLRILGCVDLNALSESGSQLDEDLRSCSVPSGVTLESVRVTSGLPKCEIECNQRQVTADIKRAVVENVCIYEWYLLSWLVIFCLKLYQYGCLLVAYILVPSALSALFRKHLRRDSVKWIYEQDMQTGEIVGAEGMSAEEAKAKAKTKFERREKWIALAKIIVAVLLVTSSVVLRIYVAKADDFLQPSWFVPT